MTRHDRSSGSATARQVQNQALDFAPTIPKYKLPHHFPRPSMLPLFHLDPPATSSAPPRRGISMLMTLATLGLLAVIIGAVVYRWMPTGRSQGPEVITHTVARGTFTYDVVERGEIESSSNVEVRSEVKTQNNSITILEVVPEGTEVEAGDILVRLDSSGLEQEAIQQRINCNTFLAQMITSQNTYEAAKIAKKEYMEGTFYQTEQEIQSTIFIAEENLRRAEEYFGYSVRLAARGYVTPQQLEGDRFAVEKAKTELATAKTRLRVLQEYTKPKMLMELESAIRSAEAAWKSDESSHKLELSKLKDIEDQITKCVIKAPESGTVIHANDSNRRGDNEFIVEPGATVREGQTIIRLPDPSKMQVKAKVNESRVTDLKEGMKATIRIDALGEKTLPGVVVRVNEYPEPNSWFTSQTKEYGTFVRIMNTLPGLKPGLTAEAIIHVSHSTNAVLVPVQSVYEHGRQPYCMVQMPDGWKAEPIVVGGNNDKFVRVDSGLDAGHVVALNPRELLALVELPEIVEEVLVGRSDDREETAEVDPLPNAEVTPTAAEATPPAAEAATDAAENKTEAASEDVSVEATAETEVEAT